MAARVGLAYTCIMTHFVTLHTHTLTCWTTFILAKMSLLTTSVASSLPFVPFLLLGRLWRRCYNNFIHSQWFLCWRCRTLCYHFLSLNVNSFHWSSYILHFLKSKIILCQQLSPQFRRLTFVNNLISNVNVWGREITILCLLPKPSYELTNCFSVLLSHASEYMSLVRFIKLGDKIRVQSTYRFLEISSRIFFKSHTRAWVTQCFAQFLNLYCRGVK